MRITHTNELTGRRTWHNNTLERIAVCPLCQPDPRFTPVQEVAQRHETARFEQGLNHVSSIIDEVIDPTGTIRTTRDYSYLGLDAFTQEYSSLPVPEALITPEPMPQVTIEPQSAPVVPQPQRPCQQCGVETPQGAQTVNNNKVYCQSCFEQYFKQCRHCDNFERISDGVTTNENNFYCQTCQYDNSFYCNGCRVYFEGNEDENINGDSYCTRCFDERGFYCDSCEEAEDNEDRYTCDTCDSEYCEDCWNTHAHNESLREGREAAQLFRDVPANTFLESDTTGCKIITHKRFVGIEIEAEQGRMDYLYKVLPQEIGISHDGSLDSTGVEIQTPPAQGIKLERLVQDACKAIRAQGYRATTNCGLHVHIDARDIRNDHNKIIQVIKTFYATEDLLFSMLPPSRWASITGRKNYCQRLSKGYLYKNFSKKLTDQNKLELEIYKTKNEAEKEQRKHNKYDNARYYGLNIHSIFFRGTVEFRYHSGTTSSEKILYWTQLMLSIFEYAINNYDEIWVQDMFDTETNRVKFEKLVTKLNLSSPLKQYMTNRSSQFNPDYLIKFNKGAEERRRDVRKYTQIRKQITEKAKTFLKRAENDVRNGYPPFRIRNQGDLQQAIQEIAEEYALQDLNIKAPGVENGFMSEEEVKSVVKFIQQGISLARNNDRLLRDTQNQDDIEQ